MIKKLLLFTLFASILAVTAQPSTAATWDPLGSLSNFQEGHSSNGDHDTFRWGMYVVNNTNPGALDPADRIAMNGSNSKARLQFAGNTAVVSDVDVELTFECYTAKNQTTTISSDEIRAFGYNDSASGINSNAGRPNVNAANNDDAYWYLSYATIPNAGLDSTNPAFQYLRLSKGLVRYTAPNASVFTIFEYDTTSLDNVTGHNDLIVAGSNPVWEAKSEPTGRIGKNYLNGAVANPIEIRIFIPYALHWTDLGNKFGVKLMGLNCPAQLRVHFYRVSQTVWNNTDGSAGITSLGGNASARNALEINAIRHTSAASSIVSNTLYMFNDSTEVADMAATNSEDGDIVDYRDNRYVYVIHYPFQGGATKAGAVYKAGASGGVGTTEDTGIEIIYSERQGMFLANP